MLCCRARACGPRTCRPPSCWAQLSDAAPGLAAVEMLTLLSEHSARLQDSRRFDPPPPQASSHPIQPRADTRRDRPPDRPSAPRLKDGPKKSRNPTLQANALVVADPAPGPPRSPTQVGCSILSDELASCPAR